ncbi:hypothetical protein HU200_011071 [Digitaria exilis]|uniref:Uncharacterized protein n=1 Tax=Digitaria exilis TaxID=1010633 RepID=A0A835FHA2_9POAL|nr:hypothetical protein HU200_011071 [Digitaria exilis]
MIRAPSQTVRREPCASNRCWSPAGLIRLPTVESAAFAMGSDGRGLLLDRHSSATARSASPACRYESAMGQGGGRLAAGANITMNPSVPTPKESEYEGLSSCVLALRHPLLNRIAESFVKAAGVSRPLWCPLRLRPESNLFSLPRLISGSVPLLLPETYFMAIEGTKTLPVLLFVFPLFLRGRISVRRHWLEETLLSGTHW